MTVIEKKQFHQYDSEQLKKLQELELLILTEFIRICEENDIEYYLDGGTAIGAIRHKGFIPWDDDIDVIMLREDYDKFINVMKDYKSDKFELLASQTKEYYCRIFCELSLKGTYNDRFYDSEYTDFNMGITIDIFALDKIPEGFIQNNLFKLRYLLFKKLLLAYEVTFNDNYISKNKERIGRIIRKIFEILGIDNNFIKRRGEALINKSKNSKSHKVANLSTTYNLTPLPKSIFSPPKKAKFENLKVNVPNDYDTYLTSIYGDYMKLPPLEKRVNHGYSKVDFGDY